MSSSCPARRDWSTFRTWRTRAANRWRPDDVVKVGDEIKVRVIEVDPQGRVNLSAIGLDEPWDPSKVKPREERRGRDGDRGGSSAGDGGGG